MIKKQQKLDKTCKLAKKISILLILATLVNFLFPQGVLAVQKYKELNREPLGELRQVFIYDPERTDLEYTAVGSRYVPVTAYTSSVYETDATPFTTANGTVVRDGIVAANFLPYGTKIRFPGYFGNKIFEVQDRMNPRYYHKIDIWMKNKDEAKSFGRRVFKMEILKEKPLPAEIASVVKMEVEEIALK